jgi:hypothetical protein
MSPLADRLRSLRWMIVPIAAYLVITLALPIANGAAARQNFVSHAAWVLGGCIAIVAVALVGGTLVEIVRTNLWRKR